MKWHSLSSQDWVRAVGVGIGVAILTAAVMVTALKSGVSPLPKPLGLAFAETVLGRPLPLPVGLLVPHRLGHGLLGDLCRPVPRRADIPSRAGTWRRAMDSRPRVLLSRRRLGLSRAGRHAQTDRRLGGTASVVCDLPVGPLQACIPGELSFKERSRASLEGVVDRISQIIRPDRSGNTPSRAWPRRRRSGGYGTASAR